MKSDVLVIVLAFNEDASLAKTVHNLILEFSPLNPKIVISTSRSASQGCQNTATKLSIEFENVNVYYQKEPYVAAAVMEVVRATPAEYVIYMSSDGETPAAYAPKLIRELVTSGADVVSASRWLPGGSLTDYGFLKTLVSRMAQFVCKVLYSFRLTEFTYGYRAYRYSVISSINFKEKKHPFFLESLLIPIRLGYRVIEIPVAWVSRDEATSVVNLKILLSYLRPVFQVRFRQSRDLTLTRD